jgi:hypothetical protein
MTTKKELLRIASAHNRTIRDTKMVKTKGSVHELISQMKRKGLDTSHYPEHKPRKSLAPPLTIEQVIRTNNVARDTRDHFYKYNMNYTGSGYAEDTEEYKKRSAKTTRMDRKKKLTDKRWKKLVQSRSAK